MTHKTTLRRLQEDVGDLLERREEASDFAGFDRYADDPVGFIRDVLGDDPWDVQEEVAEAVRDHPQVTVRSCHAAGKDWLGARLALWWTYARRGLVVLTGPTRTQVEEILMRGEVRDAFQRAGDLPGSLHVNALRPGGEGRAGILAKTATGVSALTGFHDERVLFVITEAQDPEIDHSWDAAFAVATGEHDRILTLGNPTHPTGRFYRAHQPESDWHAVKIAAPDIPNVREGRTVIPGLLTREGVERFRSEYGESSGFYASRVLAEFPSESEEGLFDRVLLEEAAARWEEGAFRREAKEAEPIVAVDVARYGDDHTVLAVRQGPRLEKLVSWGKSSISETAEKVEAHLRGAGVRAKRFTKHPKAGRPGVPSHIRRMRQRKRWRDGEGDVVVDTVGVGGGVHDRLEEKKYEVSEFKGSRSPRDKSRFANCRAESFWELRQRLEAGEIALPPDEELFRELLALRWRPDAKGRIQLESKEDLKGRLGRSPDRADAVSMSYYSRAVRGRGLRNLEPLKVG